ncbi:uncharacterized protein LOC135138908 isoform X2 [Zophobas morio]|uniref:uncharacterized protein LOC135138908 isoform X2 n=1 Tax=Zophobas morio TaxID=2755281 RepID=UPI00308270A5
MSSSSDEEIKKWKENIKDLERKIEQRKRKKREEKSNSLLHTHESKENPCSSKMIDFTKDDIQYSQIKAFGDNRYVKVVTKESMHPKKRRKIRAETRNNFFPKKVNLTGAECTPNKPIKTSADNKKIKEVTEESVIPNKQRKIDAETTNKFVLEKTFQKRSGTTIKGQKYEDMIMANIILQLVSDSKVRDFYISSNNQNFGDFDDVVIEIETDLGIETKAMQLKHSNNEKCFNTFDLTKKKGNFSIAKYFNSVQGIKGAAQQFILFTTYGTDISDKTQFKLEGEQFYLKPIKESGEDSLDLLRTSYYRFQIIEDGSTMQNPEIIQNYRTFFERFRLYTNQDYVETLKNSTVNNFNTRFESKEDIFDKYLKVIAEWNMNEEKKEKLSKKMMQRAIALQLLSTHVEPFVFDGSANDKAKIVRDAICGFDITLAVTRNRDLVKGLWSDSGKDINFEELNRLRALYSLSSNNIDTLEAIDANTLTQLFWLMDKCPLIVQEHENVEKAIQLCHDAKFVLLGEGKCKEWMIDRSVFQNLSQLESKLDLCEKVLQNFTISLQGKDEVNLKTAFEQNEVLLKHVTVNELLEMSNGSCCIGGQKEAFPNLYIERNLSVNVIDIKYLEHVNQDTFIIINCEENSEQLKISREHTLIDINDFIAAVNIDIFQTPIFIVSKNKCSDFDFQKVCSKTLDSKIVHHFKFFDSKNLEWIRSNGDVGELQNYKLNNHSKNEKEFWSFGFSNHINLITDDPGMGKTELTKSLKNGCCSKYWTVIMNPHDINSLSKTLQTCEASDYLNRFELFILNQKYQHLGQLDLEFFKMCLKQNNVVYVWDALDEILTENFDAVSDLIFMLSQKGLVQWVTARQHLKSSLEKKFNVLSVSINQFSDSDQEKYVRKRLETVVSSGDMKRTIDKIKSTFAFTKHVDILGIPLQIFMLTEIFLQNEDYLDLLNSNFLFTDLYSHFIDGKFKFFFGGKVPVIGYYWEEEVRKKKEEKLKQYEKFALKLIFPEDIFEELKIDCSQDVKAVSDECGTVGIITGLQNGIPQFVHASFAEYFVALYFSRNFEMIRRYIFFDAKYNNVRFFFDMLVGKKSPVHVAVLYKNFNELKNYDDETIKRKDDGGRSALHLICSWGQRHRRLDVEERDNVYVVENDWVFKGSLDTEDYNAALLFLLNKCDISEQDSLLKITPLECCRESESLGAELELLQSSKLEFQRSYSRNDRINILYYSAQLGYDDAVKTVISETSGSSCNEVNFIVEYSHETPLPMASQRAIEYFVKTEAEMNRVDNKCGWTPLYSAASNGHEKTVELLVKCGAEVNRATNGGRTPLYTASSNGHEKIVECLVRHGAEINHVVDNGWTSLYAASSNGHVNVVEYLVNHGAKIYSADDAGWTPLYAAAANGRQNTVECLLKCGFEVNRAIPNGRRPLHEACLNGHEKTVECLVKYGAEINCVDMSDWTPLYAAVWLGHEKTVEFLVNCEAEINKAASGGRTPLYTASSHCHERIVECLVKRGADINRANDDGETPLYAASSNGDEKIVEYLVNHGAEINRANNDGKTPLYVASANGHEKVVECLVNCGAEINCADNDGQTPLNAASLESHEKVVECLVEHRAEINRANSDGWTPLHSASSKGHEKIVECLVKSGAEINRSTNDGWTPLNAAFLNGHEEIVQFLVKHGAEINLTNDVNWPSLDTVLSNDQDKIVECLVKYGVEINRANDDGWTPLHAAASNGNENMVRRLVECGAQINRADKNDWTPLYAATSNGHQEIVECLVKHGADINRSNSKDETPLHVASSKGFEKIVECLTKFGAEINYADKEGWTPLYTASWHGNQKIVEYLVKHEAEIDKSNKHGWTPLHIACSKGHEKVVECLVKCEAEINRVDNHGRTPLYNAATTGHEKTIEYLVKCGAEINRADNGGWTPLYAASLNGYEKAVECLVKCGADVNRPDNQSRTPLDIAYKYQHRKIVEFLLLNGATK